MTAQYRVTTCLENLEMSGNLTAVRENGKCQETDKKSDKYHGKNFVGENCLLSTYSFEAKPVFSGIVVAQYA